VAKKREGMLTLIGGLKLAKGLLLVAVGVCALSLLHGDAAARVAGWLSALGVDPENHYVNRGLAKLDRADPPKLKEVGLGSLAYAAMFMTEGTGLIFKQVWAEYLTIVITTSFIPFEVYEMIQHESWLKGVIIAANVAIVVYLVLRLRRDHRWPFAS
jgi:uncharacterized membrane protein (DUF2068 family)